MARPHRDNVVKHVAKHWDVTQAKAREHVKQGRVIDADTGEVVTDLTRAQGVGTLVRSREGEIPDEVHDG